MNKYTNSSSQMDDGAVPVHNSTEIEPEESLTDSKNPDLKT